jgi:hypothetical protein
MSNDDSVRDTANSNGDQPTAPPLQQLTDPLDNWPRLPDGVHVHASVDLRADDPCYVNEIVPAGNDRTSHRRCVATRRNGTRCASRAMHHHLLCSIHTGAMRYQDGHAAKRSQASERKSAAERVLALQRLGTRAVIAETLVAQAENVQKAVTLLCQAAGSGDLAAAKALVPYLDQALGKPTERVEVRPPSTLEDLERMDTAQLERMVAEGRQRRLQLVKDADADRPGTGEADRTRRAPDGH